MNRDRRWNLSHSVRTSLLISYIIVLLTPILFNFVVFFVNVKNIQKQTDLALFVTNEQLTKIIDTYIEEIHTSSSAIILSDASQNLMNYSSNIRTTHQINQFRTLQRELSYKTIVCDYISGIYVVFPKSDTILTEQSIYYDFNFSYKCRYDLGMTIDEWEDFLNFDGYERISILHSQQDGTDHILIAQKNRSTADKLPEMLVVTELNVDSIRGILNDISMDGQSFTLLYDQNSGNTICSTLIKGGADISYSTETGKLFSENAKLSVLQTNFGGWQCAVLTPQNIYYRSFSSSIIGLMVYLLICLAGGVSLILYMTKKQYTPVEKLTASFLATMEQNTPSADANEYEQIEEALTLLLHKRTSDQENDLILHQSFTENILRILLSGRINKDSIIYRHAVNNGITFDSNRFLVILYNIEDIDNALYQVDAEYDNDLYTLLDTIVCAAAQDSSDNKYKRYATEVDERIACIVCCPDGADTEQILIDMLRDSGRIREFLSNKFGFVLSAAISDVHEELENISVCFDEAKETADYMETMGLSSQTFLYHSIPDTTSEPISFSSILDKERLFCNCMKAHDFAASKRLLQDIIDSFDLNHCSASEARLRVYGLISIITASLEEVKPMLREELAASINIDVFLHSKDVNTVCHQAEQLLDQLIEANVRQKQAASISREDKIVQYIDENLTDPNLNISIIADQFGMSPSYFSRIFKKNTGTGLLDYIHQHRIQLAKEMMRETPPIPLKEIAEKVGYTTPLAMNRAFRRYEGISPSSFRENF